MDNAKFCSCCKQTKPRSDFQARKAAKDGLQAWCADCCKKSMVAWRAKNRDRQRATERARYAANPEAGKQSQKRYRERHRERLGGKWKERRRTVTLAAYGLTGQQYDAMLESQGGCCSICKSPDPVHWSGRFQVDHDHETGFVRGLLCSRCNGGLGMFSDNTDTLLSAVNYLVAAKARECGLENTG